MNDPRFGFDDIKVTPEEGRAVSTSEIDRMAERHGFLAREAPEVALKRQRGSEDAVHQFTMRVRIKASNKFVAWCERERLTYREGFDRLVAMLD
jgi:hypothetical protein